MRLQIGDDRAGIRAKLGMERVGIGFERKKIPVRAKDFILVDRALGNFWQKEFPNAGGAARTHGVDAAVPVIHVANDADAFCGGSPYSEVCADHTSHGVKMRAKFFVGIVVAAFVKKVEIEVGEKEREGVGIENLKRFAVVGAALNFVAAGFGRSRLIRGPNGFEKAFGAKPYGIGNLGGRNGWTLKDQAGFGGPGNEEANCPAVGNGMRAENTKRVGILRSEKGIYSGVEIRRPFCRCCGRTGGGSIWVFCWHGWILRQEAGERKRGDTSTTV